MALQRRVIRQFLAKIMVSKPNFEQIEETVNLIDAPRKSRTSSFPGKIMLEVEENYIVQKKLNR